MPTNRYKLQSGPDGVVWLSLQPLLEDLKEQLGNQDLPDHARLAVETVKIFVEAMLTEHRQTEYEKTKQTIQ